MVDLEGEFGIELTDRIVGEVGQVNDGLEAFELVGGGDAGVDLLPPRSSIDAVVEPADSVEPGVVDGDVMAGSHQQRAQDGTDVSLAARQ